MPSLTSSHHPFVLVIPIHSFPPSFPHCLLLGSVVGTWIQTHLPPLNFSFLNNNSGGQTWPEILKSLWLPVSSVPMVKHPSSLPLVCRVPFPCPNFPLLWRLLICLCFICLSQWNFFGHCVRLWSPVHFSGLERVLQSSGCSSQPFFWVSPQTNGQREFANQNLETALSGRPTPSLLESPPAMD